MNQDDIAYLAVKSLKWIADNSTSREMADRVLQVLRGPGIVEVLHELAAYRDKPDEGNQNQIS